MILPANLARISEAAGHSQGNPILRHHFVLASLLRVTSSPGRKCKFRSGLEAKAELLGLVLDRDPETWAIPPNSDRSTTSPWMGRQLNGY